MKQKYSIINESVWPERPELNVGVEFPGPNSAGESSVALIKTVPDMCEGILAAEKSIAPGKACKEFGNSRDRQPVPVQLESVRYLYLFAGPPHISFEYGR